MDKPTAVYFWEIAESLYMVLEGRLAYLPPDRKDLQRRVIETVFATYEHAAKKYSEERQPGIRELCRRKMDDIKNMARDKYGIIVDEAGPESVYVRRLV